MELPKYIYQSVAQTHLKHADLDRASTRGNTRHTTGRVAKGRHYPFDVLVGLGLGVGLGLAVETRSRAAAGWAKVAGGILITGMWGCFFLVPIVAAAGVERVWPSA